VVLDVRASIVPESKALERTRARTNETKRRSRIVIAVTTTWYPGKILGAWDFPSFAPSIHHGQKVEGDKYRGSIEDRRGNQNTVAMVRETTHRV
jgi:hypothetical protein